MIKVFSGFSLLMSNPNRGPYLCPRVSVYNQKQTGFFLSDELFHIMIITPFPRFFLKVEPYPFCLISVALLAVNCQHIAI